MKRKTEFNGNVILTPTTDTCVETQAQFQYQAALTEMLKENSEGSITRLETLRLFLAQADFKSLRSQSEPHLAKGGKVTFTVYLDGGQAVYNMDVT